MVGSRPGPSVELITDTPTPEGSEGLLAIILRGTKDDQRVTSNGPLFLTPPSAPMQVAFMRYQEGKTLAPHSHPVIHRNLHCPTAETIIVMKGKVTVHLWNSQRVHQRDIILEQGDLIVLFSGGHSFTMLEESEIVEVKQGPYDQDKDKTWW